MKTMSILKKHWIQKTHHQKTHKDSLQKTHHRHEERQIPKNPKIPKIPKNPKKSKIPKNHRAAQQLMLKNER